MAIMNFNYGRAINQADQVDAIAEEMLKVANKQLQSTVDSIGASWRGEASKQFLEYCTSTQADIRTQAKRLQDLARRIKNVARIIEEAEQRAKELQRQRAAAVAAAAKNTEDGSSGSRGKGGGGGGF